MDRYQQRAENLYEVSRQRNAHELNFLWPTMPLLGSNHSPLPNSTPSLGGGWPWRVWPGSLDLPRNQKIGREYICGSKLSSWRGTPIILGLNFAGELVGGGGRWKPGGTRPKHSQAKFAEEFSEKFVGNSPKLRQIGIKLSFPEARSLRIGLLSCEHVCQMSEASRVIPNLEVGCLWVGSQWPWTRYT